MLGLLFITSHDVQRPTLGEFVLLFRVVCACELVEKPTYDFRFGRHRNEPGFGHRWTSIEGYEVRHRSAPPALKVLCCYPCMQADAAIG